MALVPTWTWIPVKLARSDVRRGDPVPVEDVQSAERDLNRRMRALAQRINTTGLIAGGQGTGSGDGAETAFTVAHGLALTPDIVLVTPASADAAGDFHASVDGTNITITYASPPGSGADNLTWYWAAIVTREEA